MSLGRPKLEKKKSSVIHIRLTGDEDAAFTKKAEEIGQNRSEIVRRIIREIINNEPEYFNDGVVEIRAMHRELAAVGRNLNQLVQITNSDGILDSIDLKNELGYVSKGVEKVKKQYAEAIDRVRGRNITRMFLPVISDKKLAPVSNVDNGNMVNG